jgi:peptidoglycan hydrolase-like protein with peptidoglycan-binding domain
VETLIVLPILLFVTLFGLEVWIVMQRHVLMERVLNVYLVRAQLEGTVSDDMRQDILADLQRLGFDPAQVRFGNSTPPNVIRRRGEPVVLQIGYPKGPVLEAVRLLGLEPPDPEGLMWVGGTVISERP